MSRRPVNTSKFRIKARETEYRCLLLRKQGLSYTEVASRTGLSEHGVAEATRRALERMLQRAVEDAPMVRDLELARLDEVLRKHLESAKKGDPKSADIVLKIMERRAKYLGLDAAQKMVVEHGGMVRVYKGVDTSKV